MVKPKKSSHEVVYTVLRQIAYTKLFKKYSSGNYSFNKICINNLVFNENCLVVSRFKDFLILDDNTDFFRRFYCMKDCIKRLNRILYFYEKYSKIFPNYLVLKENKYLYRNIRKKQKMIDALNELKREEKENRQKLKNMDKCKGKTKEKELFTKKIKDEIKTFQKNISFKKYKNSFDSDKNNIDDTLFFNQNSISIYYRQLKDEDNDNIKDNIYPDSFITNQTNGSISNIVNVLNDNKIYTKDLPKLLAQNNNKNFFRKNKKSKNKNDIKNKNNKNVKNKKEANQSSLKTFNNLSIKEENELRNSMHIKNNSQIKKKKNADKNNLYKYAITSSNATNSSSMLSKKIKNQQTSSPTNNKSNKDINVNEVKNKNIQNNNDINKNENNENNDKNNKNILFEPKRNIYQKTSPNYDNNDLNNNLYKTTNNGFKKNSESINKDKNIKENIQKNKVDNTKKSKYTINKEIVKKKYIRFKHISQDFDSNLITKVTENLLNKNSNNKNTIVMNENSLNVINTENNTVYNSYKNFMINDNPNLITGDTKSNERNEKNFMEDKALVDVKDIIKQEKEKDQRKTSKKLFLTAQKAKYHKKNNLNLKLTKTKINSQELLKTVNYEDSHKNHLNTIDNNINLRKNKAINTDNNDENKKIRNNSAITKQKTEFKFVNKKFMSKEQKTKTKAIFLKNKLKKIEHNKNILVKSSENFYKKKEIFKNCNDNKEKNKEMNVNNNNNKLLDLKDRATLTNSMCEHKNESERRMITNLSDLNINKHKTNLSSKTKHNKKFKTKNNMIKKNFNNKMHSNNSARFSNGDEEKKYKSFLIKNKNKINTEFNHKSQKNILSNSIINRIQEVKKNKTKNDFYNTIKNKSSKSNTIDIDNNFINNIIDKNNNINNKLKNNRNKRKRSESNTIDSKRYPLKTPDIKNKKTSFFKNHMSKKLKTINDNKAKDDITNNYNSSFSIKVNKSNYNKDGIKNKNKNLKKTWTKNVYIYNNQITNMKVNQKNK